MEYKEDKLKYRAQKVHLQNYVIKFVEEQAALNDVSFSKQLNSLVRMFMRHYDYKI